MTKTIAEMRDQLQADNVSAEAEPVSRLAWLGPIRILVIAIIAFGYASTMPRGPGNAEYLNMFGYDPSWYGIQIIFMISGFLALRSLHRHGSALKFLLSRLLRNLPALAVFAGLVILVLFPLFAAPLGTGGAGETRLGQHMQYFIKVVSCFDPGAVTPGLLDNALYMCVIQGGLWTFRWGLIAFMATALLWGIGGLRNPRMLVLLTLGTMMGYAAVVVFSVHNPDMVFGRAMAAIVTGLRLGWVYMFGMCLYGFRTHLPRTLAVPSGFLALAAAQYIFLPWTPFIEICAELGLGYLVFLAMTSSVQVPKRIRKLPDLSLGLYVYNWPAAQITLLLIPTLSPLALFTLSFPMTILLSYITWLLVSRPINLNLGKSMVPSVL